MEWILNQQKKKIKIRWKLAKVASYLVNYFTYISYASAAIHSFAGTITPNVEKKIYWIDDVVVKRKIKMYTKRK